jgi:hypothetical protein
MKRLAIIGLVFLCIGCTSYVKYYPYKFNNESAHSVNKVVLAPFNLYSPLPAEVQHRERFISDGIKAYLDNKSVRADESSVEIRAIWEEEKKKIGGIYDSNNGHLLNERLSLCLRNTAVRICKSQAVDAIVFPALIMRKATLNGIVIYWDGTEQIIQSNNGDINPFTDEFSGDAVAFSLEIILIDKDGHLILHNIVGIEHPYQYVKEGLKGKWELRKDMLTDKGNIGRAVAMSFHPFIPCSEYPAKVSFSQE